MATIPLPALSLNKQSPPPDPLAQYAQILQLKQMQQAQPLQLQILQNQNQAGQLANQEAQIQLQDKQAVTQAMQQWEGKDINSLYSLVLKNGGSGQAVFGMKKQALDMESTIAQTAKNQGDAGLATIEAQQKKNDSVVGALLPLTDPTKVPDAQLPQAIQQTVQSLVQGQMLDPQHAQAAQQLLQSGDPNAIRSGLKQFANTLLAQSQITSQALDTAKAGASNAAAAKDNATTQFYQNNPQLGAPGVPIDAVQMRSWLAQNPGKTPADYKAWEGLQNPEGHIMINQLPGGGGGQGSPGQPTQPNNSALDLAAQNYLKTGQLPQELSRSTGTITAVIQRAAELNKLAGGPGLSANTAEYKANQDSLKNLQSNFDQVEAFTNTAKANVKGLESVLGKLPDSGSRLTNIPVRMVSSATVGAANMAEFKTRINSVQTEAAKIINSSNASGVLSDSARHELQEIVDPNATVGAIRSSLKALQSEWDNRTTGYRTQIEDIRGRLGNVTSSPTSSVSQPGSAPKSDPFAQFGGTAHQQ